MNSLLSAFFALPCFSVFSRTHRELSPKNKLASQSSSLPPQEHAHSGALTSLQDLLTEAEQNNPQIQAARQGWQAAKQVPSQVSTLPDPQFTVQQVNVGSPRPFAGYTNSDFAYFGLGVSQDIPYPGKLRLKGEMAKRDADVAQQQYESVRRSVLAGVKSAYFQLAYLSKTLGILESDGQLLQQVEKAADARYRSGMGNQQDLLQAQLEQTKLLREITMHHLEVAKAQAQIKQLLNRPQSSPDIETAELARNTASVHLRRTACPRRKPRTRRFLARRRWSRSRSLQVDLAHKDFYPDFNVQYMWQRTDPTQFRAYYMLSVGVRVPIYRSRKQRPELAQAEANLNRSRSESEAQTQQVAFELRTEYDTAQKTAELLKIYREGLASAGARRIPGGSRRLPEQRQDFQALLASFLDVLHLDEEYWQSVAERETALAQLEELTGLSLREEGDEADENLSHRVLAGIDWKHRARRRSSRDCGWHYRAREADVGRGNQACATSSGARFDGELDGRTARHRQKRRWCRCKSLPQRLQSIGVKTGEVERKSVEDEIRTTGNVAVDETRLAYVQVRFSGYIQKVFADATYQYVRKGQPLFTIYSPDLVATEREYLVAKQNQQQVAQSTVPGVASSAASLLDAAAERLKQWGVPQQEIARLESTGQVQQELEVDSPVSGYITERNALPSVAVQPEMRLYTIADLSTVWVQAQVFQNDLGRIKIGAPATLTVDTFPGRTFTGRVDFIYPQVDMDTRTAKVRVVFSNPGLQLKPGMFVNVTLKVPMGQPTRHSCNRRPAVRHSRRLLLWIAATATSNRAKCSWARASVTISSC